MGPQGLQQAHPWQGIEDDFLRVDETALQGPEAKEAKELVTSCYLRLGMAQIGGIS